MWPTRKINVENVLMTLRRPKCTTCGTRGFRASAETFWCNDTYHVTVFVCVGCGKVLCPKCKEQWHSLLHTEFRSKNLEEFFDEEE